VPRSGGVATNLGVPANSNSLPKFSPDGHKVALLTTIDGAYELATVSIDGGPLDRITHYPRNGKGLMQWLPGDRLLYFTESDFRFVASQIYTVPVKGGQPQKVNVPYGADCSLSANGEWLAYTLHYRRDLYWKPYAGGMAPDIWLFNLKTGKSKQITNWKGYDYRPMWHGDRVYYISNAGPDRTVNVWAYDTRNGKRTQITQHKGVDIQNPYMSLQTNEIAYQLGGDVWVLDLASGKDRRINIEIPTEAQKIEPRKIDAAIWLASRTISPSGEQVITEARGDLWLTPASGGSPKNLTHTAGVFERDPAWSPDGKHIACFSDETGEYQLTLIDPMSGGRRTVTGFQQGFRQQPRWSPDSKYISFTDDSGKFFVCNVLSATTAHFDTDLMGQVIPTSWSPDSRWIAYSKYGLNSQLAVWVYDVRSARTHQLTKGFARDTLPVFDSTGNYLFYTSVRDFSRRLNQVLDRATVYPTPTVIVAVPLRKGQPGPGPTTLASQATVNIDIEGFEARGIQLPIPSGRFSWLATAGDGKLLYHRTNPLEPAPIQMIDFKSGGSQQTVLDSSDGFEVSADGKKVLAIKEGRGFVLDVAPSQKPAAEVVSRGFDTVVDPMLEWNQISRDVWRLFRDYFYDPKMHGLDWKAQWQRFQPMLGRVAHRDDLNYVLGEMISDLDVGHAMMTGAGDIPSPPWKAAGQLGAEFEVINGAFRITQIYRGAAWDPFSRGPLSQPGSEVSEGEYVLEIDGKAPDLSKDIWASLMGFAGRQVTLTVGPNSRLDAQARKVTVTALERESDLKLRHWVEKNRQYVERASGGKLGYMFVPDESPSGMSEFVRQFYGQMDKQGLIVDVRWNTGGTSSDRMIEMLSRPLLNSVTERYAGRSYPIPENRIAGPKALLINRVTSSSGENFAYYFRKAGLGKLIGTRTWGGLIGVNGNQSLIDGGFWWIPQAAFFVDSKNWMPEGIGISPDIEVMDDPAKMRNGEDPQLDAAIRHLLKELPKARDFYPKPPSKAKTSG
jgi:tricorn protease